MDLARSIRIGLAREGKTQGWLSEQIGATRPTICHYCTGKAQPGPERIRQMAEVFGMTVSEFIALGEK